MSGSEPPTWTRLLQRSEAPLLIVGVVLVAVLATELVLAWIWDPTVGRAMLAGMGAEILTGREGGIPIAIAGGVPPVLVWQVSFTQDIAFWCLIYPWFLMVYHHRKGSGGFIMRRLERLERAARRHEAFARKWGPFGIFLFMLTPFLINGPMVGGILGRIVGIRTRHLVVPVVASTMLSAAMYVFFFDWTVGLLVDVDPRLGYAVASTIFVGFLTAGIIALIRDEQRHRHAQDDASARDEEE